MLPPSSTLFPYTTLFRSIPTEAQSSQPPWDNLTPEIRVSECGPGRTVSGTVVNDTPQRTEFDVTVRWVTGQGQELGSSKGQDRKSTRLNSSHPSISYAVF